MPARMRAQINDAMMRELGEVRAAVAPTDTLLVVDAMTGQEAAGLVKAFNDAAELTGELNACFGFPSSDVGWESAGAAAQLCLVFPWQCWFRRRGGRLGSALPSPSCCSSASVQRASHMVCRC